MALRSIVLFFSVSALLLQTVQSDAPETLRVTGTDVTPEAVLDLSEVCEPGGVSALAVQSGIQRCDFPRGRFGGSHPEWW